MNPISRNAYEFSYLYNILIFIYSNAVFLVKKILAIKIYVFYIELISIYIYHKKKSDKEKFMFGEFKQFISRGNVLDLAVGIIIGAAFTGIVNSLVADILMPPIGRLMGGIDFSNFFINLSEGSYSTLKAAKEAGAATINYGVFLNQVINFTIVSFAVFMLVKQANRLKKKQDDAPVAPPRSEILLEEIRDLLKK